MEWAYQYTEGSNGDMEPSYGNSSIDEKESVPYRCKDNVLKGLISEQLPRQNGGNTAGVGLGKSNNLYLSCSIAGTNAEGHQELNDDITQPRFDNVRHSIDDSVPLVNSEMTQKRDACELTNNVHHINPDRDETEAGEVQMEDVLFFERFRFDRYKPMAVKISEALNVDIDYISNRTELTALPSSQRTNLDVDITSSRFEFVVHTASKGLNVDDDYKPILSGANVLPKSGSLDVNVNYTSTTFLPQLEDCNIDTKNGSTGDSCSVLPEFEGSLLDMKRGSFKTKRTLPLLEDSALCPESEDVNHTSNRQRRKDLDKSKESNLSPSYKSTKCGCIGLPASVGSDLDLNCGYSEARRTYFPLSNVLDADLNSKTADFIKPEESDVDLLYSYYTCVSPGRRDEPFFQKIKSEPWIDVSQLQGVMPGDRVKIQNVTENGYPPPKSDRELMAHEYNDTVSNLEPNSREDILIAELHNVVWQPFVKLERSSEMIPSQTNKRFIQLTSPSRPNTSEVKTRKSSSSLGVPLHDIALKNGFKDFDTDKLCTPKIPDPEVQGDNSLQPVSEMGVAPPNASLNIVLVDNGTAERVKTNKRQLKCAVEATGTETTITAPEIPLSNFRQGNRQPEILELTESETESQRELENYSQSVMDTKVCPDPPDLGDIKDDEHTRCVEYSRPKRRSAMKAIEILQSGIIASDKDESDTDQDEMKTSEDSDYADTDDSSSEDDTGTGNDEKISGNELSVDGENALNSSIHSLLGPRAKKRKIIKSSQQAIEINEEGEGKPVRCHTCGQRFNTDGTMRRHNLTAHRNLLENVQLKKCNICAVEFFYDHELKRHQLIIHQKVFKQKTYPCDICDREFRWKGQMLRHKEIIHCEDRKCVCELCGQVFVDKGRLLRHLDDHKKPFTCDVCNTSWSRLYNLQMHMRTHTGEKPFKCEVCQQGFSRLHNMKVHIKSTHKDVLRYECKNCTEKFKTFAERIEHSRKKHPPKAYKKYPCRLCGIRIYKRAFSWHERLHKEGQIMKCERCEKHVQLTMARYKYKLKGKNDKSITVCHGCFEEHAKTFKPEDYQSIRYRCRILNNCQYCGKTLDVKKQKAHEIMCQQKTKSTERTRTNDIPSDIPGNA